MVKFRIGDYVIATKDKEPFFRSWSGLIIPKGAVGKITCVTIDNYVNYLNVIWISEELNKEQIPVSADGLKPIPQEEHDERAFEMLLTQGFKMEDKV